MNPVQTQPAKSWVTATVVDASAGAPITPDQEKLKAYSHLKLSLASQLRLFRDVLKKRGNEHRDRQCQELMVKLAEDRFTLAVLGQFKRGKSSLMNAIIGRDLAPTGVLPLTSAITVLKFGPKERLVVEREGLLWPEVAPISQLAEYVTERGNPGNRKKVTTANVEIPLPFLRRGLEFVDTPGVGSAITTNTATTYAFLPQCDAVLFVTSVDSPFTSVELELLQNIRRYVHKIFFLVNKIDLLNEREQRDVLEFVAQTIRTQMDSDEVRVFPLSCTLGLAAKAAGDSLAYTRSGLQTLEEELGRFLSYEKTATFLATIVDRAQRLVAAEAGERDLSARARELPPLVFQQRLDELQRQWRQHAAIRHDIFQEMRTHVMQEIHPVFSPVIDAFLASERAKLPKRLDRALPRASWRPCAAFARRITGFVLAQLRRKIVQLTASRTEHLSFADDSFCREHWEALQSNLGEIANLASVTLGLEGMDFPNPEQLGPWRLDAKFAQLSTVEVHSSAHLPSWLKLLPGRVVTPWLKKHLEREHARLIESNKEPLLAAIEHQLNTALDQLWSDVSKRAAEIESRVQATMTGERREDATRTALDSLRQKLLALRQDILRLPNATSQVEGQSSSVIESVSSLPAVENPIASPAEADLLKHLRTRGCPVCDYLRNVVFDFFSRWQYALSSDEKAQAEFAAELGVCPLHAWQLEAISSPVGSSLAYPKLAERVRQLLTQAASAPDCTRAVRQLLRNSRHCRVCYLLREAEKSYTTRLAEFLTSIPQGCDVYRRSQGACLRHLTLLVATVNDDIARVLLAHAAHWFENIAEDMQAFAMKTDALRRGLRNLDEEDAYMRMITHLVGGKAVTAPWEEEIEV
jgi:predicted GTPase